MKVVHVCMHSFLDGWGYQENLLASYMAEAGHEVVVVSSNNKFPSYVSKEEVDSIKAKGNDYYLDQVHVYRIKKCINIGNTSFYSIGLFEILEKEQPDLIFHHGVNNYTMLTCGRYCKRHPETKMVVDNHADEINKSTNKIWNLFYQDTLLYLCVKKVQKYVIKFYGVTPGRCDFLDRPYGAPKNKITLLPIGGDTNQTDNIQLSKSQLRSKYNIPLDSIVIVTGGKMGIGKGTDSLLSACKTLSKKYQNIRLLMFGRFLDEKTQKQSEEETVAICHGWCDRNTTLELLKLSDVACWPIHHTTLIEDAVASALPLIVRKTPNTTHLVNGNGEYVEDGTSEELVLALEKIVNNYEQYKEQALIMHDKFSYKNIVKQIEKDYEDGK